MPKLILTKFLTKTVIAASLTLGLVLLSNYDTSSENLKSISIDDAVSGIYDGYEVIPQVLPEPDTPKIKPIETPEKELNPNEYIEDISVEGGNIKTIQISGTASHYADKFHGRLTANGEAFNMYGYTCANKTLPFGTIIKITNLSNNESVLVKVNDRGPYVNDRIIDLSFGAANAIGDLGLPKIEAEYVSKFAGLNKDLSGKYFGFSKTNPIKLYNKSDVKLIDEFEDFTTAYKAYLDISSESNINNTFIFVDAKDKYYKNTTYRVGQVKPNVLFASK